MLVFSSHVDSKKNVLSVPPRLQTSINIQFTHQRRSLEHRNLSFFWLFAFSDLTINPTTGVEDNQSIFCLCPSCFQEKHNNQGRLGVPVAHLIALNVIGFRRLLELQTSRPSVVGWFFLDNRLGTRSLICCQFQLQTSVFSSLVKDQ